jgi:hypothetical protein
MKLQLEVSYVDTAANYVVFKPLHCSLEGDLVYRGIPRRATEQFKIGQVLEATVPLPDYYPEKEAHEQHRKRDAEERVQQEDLMHPLDGGHRHGSTDPLDYRERFGGYPVANNIERIAGLVRQVPENLEGFSQELRCIALEVARHYHKDHAWRPIDSAPHDTWIIVVSQEGVEVAMLTEIASDPLSYVKREGWKTQHRDSCGTYQGWLGSAPTYWQPLPEAPAGYYSQRPERANEALHSGKGRERVREKP